MGIVVIVLTLALVACAVQIYRLAAEARAGRKAERMKRAFLHGMSREMRTPLHTVAGMAEVIADESLYLSKSEKRNISEQIKYNAGLVATLLDEFMVLADKDAGGHQVELQEVSPNILCRRCLDANERLNERKDKLRMTYRRELSDEFFVHTDPHVVELALNKLIRSAYRFTEQGEIVVGCNTTDNPDCLTIYVQDTGVGIPVDRREHLFSWYEHPDDTRDEVEMEMSLVQRIVERVGGTVRLDDFYTGGTRLMVVLPIR